MLAALSVGTSCPLAQLSPGKLHSSHAFLEGVDNCNKCHSPDRKNLSRQCLQCHTAIAERRDSGLGLHAKQGYDDCELCHIEHQGRDFTLIYFKGGEQAFDHSLTGYVLEGAHARLDCRKCHNSDHIRNSTALAAQSVAIDRTYLGLTRNCLSCHLDEHRGQLSEDCGSCHSFKGWKPVTAFDHNLATFRLTGKHASVDCSKCHAPLIDEMIQGSPSYTNYKPITHENCTNCHKDAHEGRLGNDCAGCHTSAGWKRVKTAEFDHDRTRYPLEGRHASVDCKSCHTGNPNTEKLKFGQCLSCHSDYHKGEFAHRVTKGACEECHTVGGFRPAVFRLSQHDSTDYPLKGAHQAIPCDQCHRVTRGGSLHFVFAFKSTDCIDCHRDPHQGTVKRWVESDGCESCHTVGSWSDISFDHSTTEFKLVGKHQDAACTGCHSDKSSKQIVMFSGTDKSAACESCHKDTHGGQFAQGESGATTDCAQCHTPDNWEPGRFNHARDSRFVLDGAHAKVECVLCHKAKGQDDQREFVIYKPLDTACKSCHADGGISGKADS